MARHRRRYRRTSLALKAESIAAGLNSAGTTPALSRNGQLSVVRQDLIKTAVVTIVLVGTLIIAYYLNQRFSWTLPLGSKLYQLLHIR